MIYFNFDGKVYWHMENIINRCDESETYEQREKEGRLPKSRRKGSDPKSSELDLKHLFLSDKYNSDIIY